MMKWNFEEEEKKNTYETCVDQNLNAVSSSLVIISLSAQNGE